MLGPVGKVAKSALTSAGYELYRPTAFERSLIGSYWANWLSRDPELFGKIYAQNRAALKQVPSWADDIDNSLWRYGVPPMWSGNLRELGKTSLDEIEHEITYSDLIGFVASRIQPLKYLEIGVSVGKNFWQIANLFPEATLYGLDVEEPNPSLVRLFDRVEVVWEGEEQTVETLSGKPATIRLTHYHLHRSNAKPVTYVKGDQFSPATWESIRESFNFIFSDGVHSARAVRDELKHLQARELLDRSGKFAMYWDDLVNADMQHAFDENARSLGDGSHSMHWIHGTYGNRRLNGIFASF